MTQVINEAARWREGRLKDMWRRAHLRGGSKGRIPGHGRAVGIQGLFRETCYNYCLMTVGLLEYALAFMQSS